MQKLMSVVFLLATTPAVLANAPLRIGIPEPTQPPMAVIVQRQLTGGYLYTLGSDIAQRLNTEPEFIIIPAKRVESLLLSRAIDIVCHVHPAWLDTPAKFRWTQTIYEVSGHIISLKSIPDIRTIHDLSGKKISTVLGYSYPSLAYLWNKNKATRFDEKNIDQMLRALRKRITDVAIVQDKEFDAWSKRHPQDTTLYKIHPFSLGTRATMCAVSPKSPFSVEQINKAIASFRSTHTSPAG